MSITVNTDRMWYFDDATPEELRILWDIIPTLGTYRLGKLWEFVFEKDYWYATADCPTSGVEWFIGFLREGL